MTKPAIKKAAAPRTVSAKRKPAPPVSPSATADPSPAAPTPETTQAPAAAVPTPSQCAFDWEHLTPESSRKLGGSFANVFGLSAPGIINQIPSNYQRNKAKCKRISNAVNLAETACVAYLDYIRCAAGLESPNEETKKQLAESGVNLSGKPLADIFVRPLDCSVWPWKKHGVVFLSDDEAGALQECLQSDLVSLSELTKQERLGLAECKTEELRTSGEIVCSFSDWYSLKLSEIVSDTIATLARYRAALEKVTHVRQEIRFTIKREEIDDARARLAASAPPSAEPPAAPVAPSKTAKRKSERKKREQIPESWKRAVEAFMNDECDRWPASNSDLWRMFTHWRNLLNKGKTREYAMTVPDASALRRARDSVRHRPRPE